MAQFIDWSKAFDRQDAKLTIENFIKMGVRPSLIPVVASFFQNRTMTVKWHDSISTPRELQGGGPQGSIFGGLSFKVNSNDNADHVDEDLRFKFVDDLSTLEIVNLLATWISSFNVKVSVPNNLPLHNQFIDAKHLKSQQYLDEIEKWTQSKKMILNVKKPKLWFLIILKSISLQQI